MKEYENYIRCQRSKICIPLDIDSWSLDKEVIDSVLKQFQVEKKNENLNEQLVYLSSCEIMIERGFIMKCILKVGKNEYDYNNIKLVIYSSYINKNDEDDVFWGTIHKKHPENFNENFQPNYSELFIKFINNDQSFSLMSGCNLINICRFKNMIDDAFCYDESSVPYLECVRNEDGVITTKIVDVVKSHNVFVQNIKEELGSKNDDMIPLLSLEALC